MPVNDLLHAQISGEYIPIVQVYVHLMPYEVLFKLELVLDLMIVEPHLSDLISCYLLVQGLMACSDGKILALFLYIDIQCFSNVQKRLYVHQVPREVQGHQRFGLFNTLRNYKLHLGFIKSHAAEVQMLQIVRGFDHFLQTVTETVHLRPYSWFLIRYWHR